MLIHLILHIMEDHHMVVSCYIQVSRMRVCQWQPTMLVQPRLVYPTQLVQEVSAIPTTHVVTTIP